jgi:dTDP-4-dehydrorhamnose 3,5-epimerase
MSADGVKVLRGPGPIAGVQVVPLRRIPDERGTIFHMLRASDPHFLAFGEVYFATVYKDVVKGWHKHRDMTLNYACPIGRIKLVLYDERDGSASRGALMEVYLGPDSYHLVVIPPGVWSGFKGMAEPFSLVANCATHGHDPGRSTRIDPFDPRIPYHWAVKLE